MSVDMPFTIGGVGLLHDTGSSNTDLISANLTVIGRIDGELEQLRAVIQFDHDDDGQSDGDVSLERGQDVFAYDPRHRDPRLVDYQGAMSLGYRGVLVDSQARQVWVGEWAQFSFTAESTPLAPWRFEQLQLKHDTSGGSGVTTDPTIVGRIRHSDDASQGQGGSGSGGSGGAGGGDGGSVGGSGGTSQGGNSNGGGSNGTGSGPAPGGSASGGSGATDGDSALESGDYSTVAFRTMDVRPFISNSELPAPAAGEPLDRAAIEWDLNEDGLVDARTWLQGAASFEHRPSLPNYGSHDVRSRVIIWDSLYGVPLKTEWQSLAFVFVAEPAAVIDSLELLHDTGASSDDRLTSDPTLVGRLDGAEDKVAGATVYFDADGDGIVDGRSVADSRGRFHWRPKGLAPGLHRIQARPSRWDDLAEAEVLGAWVGLEFTYEPDLPPSIDSLQLVAGQTVHDARWMLVGQLIDPVAGLTIEFDDDGNGLSDGHAVTDAGGKFRRQIAPAQSGSQTTRVRSVAWDRLDAVPRAGSWQTMTYHVPDERSFSISLTGLQLRHDTGADNRDRVTSDPTFIGQIVAPSNGDGAFETWQVIPWLEVDRNADGTADDYIAVDASQRFIYRPSGLVTGRHELKLRAAAWDERTGRLVRDDWTPFEFTLERDRVVPPSLAELGLLVDNGPDSTDGRTSAPWLTGRLAEAAADNLTLIEMDVAGDGIVDAVVVPDVHGRFLHRLHEAAFGPVSVHARPVRWDTTNGQYAAGEWSTFSFVHESYLHEAPRLLESRVEIRSAAPGTDGDSVTIVGRVGHAGDLDGLLVEFDNDGDGLVDGATETRRDGAFSFTLLALPPGDAVVRMRVAEAKPTGETLSSDWGLLTVTARSVKEPIELPSVPASDRVAWLKLAHDTGGSDSDRATADPRVRGQIQATRLAQRLIEFDSDSDGTPDATTRTADDGSFEFLPENQFEGVVAIAARLADGGDDSVGWVKTQFVLSSEPDGRAAQELAAAVRPYEEAREASVRDFYLQVDAARQARYLAMLTAARERNESFRLDVDQHATQRREADERFHTSSAQIQATYQADLRAAEQRFADRLATYGGDTSAMNVPRLVWPDAPPSGRLALESVNGPAWDAALESREVEVRRWTALHVGEDHQRALAASSDSLSASQFVASRRVEQEVSDADQFFLDETSRARRVWESDVRKTERDYAADLAQPHPSLDLELETLQYHTAVQHAENTYAAARRFHDGQHFTEMARLTVKFQHDMLAAQWKYESEMERLNNTPGGGEGDYYRTHLEWRRQIHWDFFTEMALAHREYNEGVAKAHQVKETRDAHALAQRDRAIRLAETVYLGHRLDYDTWDQHRRLVAWEKLEAALAGHEAAYQSTVAEAVHRHSLSVASGQLQHDVSLAESDLAHAERLKAALLVNLLRRAAEVPDLPGRILGDELMRASTTAAIESARLQADLASRRANARFARRADEAVADLRHATREAASGALLTKDYAGSEVTRMKAILSAAGIEARQELVQRHAFFRDLIDARLDRDLARADARYAWDMKRAEIDFDHQIEVRDIRLDYMFHYHATPIEVPLAAAGKRQEHRHAHAAHAYEQAIYNIEESYSDRDVAENLEYELAAHGLHEARALQVAEADRQSLNSTQRATAKHEVEVGNSATDLRVARFRAEDAWIRFLVQHDGDREVGTHRVENERLLADAAARSKYDTRLARDRLQRLERQDSEAYTAPAWVRYQTALAAADTARIESLGASEAAWLTAWAAADQSFVETRRTLFATLVDEQVTAFATLVGDVAGSHRQLLADFQTAYVAAGDGTSAATNQYLATIIPADRQHLDRRSRGEWQQEEEVRDADFDFRRSASDARLARRVDAINEEELDQALAAARQVQRVTEAAAFVQFAMVIADSHETRSVAMARAKSQHVAGWSAAAQQNSQANIRAEQQDKLTQLAAWLVMQQDADRAETALHVQLAAANTLLQRDVASAGSRHHREMTLATHTWKSESEVAARQWRLEQLEEHYRNRNEFWAFAESGNGSGAYDSALLKYQTEVARQDVYHAIAVRDAARRLMADRVSAELRRTDGLNIADSAWLMERAAADEQLTARLAAVREHYGRDYRQAMVDHAGQMIVSEGQAEQATAAAQASRQRAVARADEDFEVAVAAANKRWTIRVAEARAEAHIAGESTEGLEGRDDDSLSPAQRAFLAALRAADQVYAVEVQAAAVLRAGAFGDAWIDLHTVLGQAARIHAATMGTADELLQSRWNAAAVAYTIMATDASRDYVVRTATAETSRDVSAASAQAHWVGDMVDADDRFQRDVGAADVVWARETARAETEYHLATTSAATAVERALRDWLTALAPAYVQYREDLAYAVAHARNQLSWAAALRDRAIAASDTVHAQEAGIARVDHARATITAFIDHQLAMLVIDQQLKDDVVKADSLRKIDYADRLAEHDVVVASAGKELLVADALAYPAATSPEAEHAYLVAVADADRRFKIGKSQADLQHGLLLIPAETTHALAAVSATSQLHVNLAGAHGALRLGVSSADERHANAEAAARARFANEETAADNALTWLNAVAETHWQSAHLQTTRSTLQQFAANSSTPWTRFHADQADAIASWWGTAQHELLAWVGERNRIEATYTATASQAFELLIGHVGRADSTRVASETQADQTRTAQEAAGRTRYVQRLGNPASLTDRLTEQAEHDYRVAVANAEYDLAVGGSREAYDHAVAEAAARRGLALQAAQRTYRQEEAVASSELRGTITQAESHQQRARFEAAAVWSLDVQSALLRFESVVDEAAAVRARALAVVDAGHRYQEAALRDVAFAELAARNDSPWALRTADRARAETWRQEQLRGTIIARADDTNRARRQFVTAEADAAHDFITRQSEAIRQWQQQTAAVSGELTDQQAAAARAAAALGWQTEFDRWVGLMEGGIVEWLPGGSLLAGSLVGAGLLLDQPLMGLLSSVRSSDPMSPQRFLEGKGSGPAFGYLRVVPAPRLGGPLVADPRVPLVLPQHPPRPEDMDAAAMMRLGLMHMPPPSELQTKSTWQWFLDDLNLMQRYPRESLQGAAQGLRTSGKVFVNGTATTLKSTITLGFGSSPWELLSVTDEDRMNGYDAAFAILRISQEFLVGRGLGRLAKPTGDPWRDTVAKGFFYWDVAQNSASSLRGGYGVVYGDGWTLGNTVELLGGVAGLSGNALGRFRHTDDLVPQRNGEILDHKVGLGVRLGDSKDKIGHAFLIFERPNGNRFAVGFYPNSQFSFGSTKDRFKFIFGGNLFGAPAKILSDTDTLRMMDTSAGWTKAIMYNVSERGFFEALNHVRQTVKATRSLKQRYHLFSQCAVFGRDSLARIGIRPYVQGAYPPYIYFRIWLHDLRK